MLEEKTQHFRQSAGENGFHLIPRKVLSRQNKRSNAAPHQGLQFQMVLPYLRVLGQDNPLFCSSHGQPPFVFGVLREMIIVDLNPASRRAQGRRSNLFSERAIEEENKLVKQLRVRARSGSLPGCRGALDHSRPQAARPNRQP